jgi:hypothetical protein
MGSEREDDIEIVSTPDSCSCSTECINRSPSPIYDNVSVEQIRILSRIVGCTLTQMFHVNANPDPTTLFSSGELPSIGIQDYVIRLTEHSACSFEAIIHGFIYACRVITVQPSLANIYCMHRLFLACLLCATKYYDDLPDFKNSVWAEIGGISLRELNHLQVEFLSLINFDLYVNVDTYNDICTQLHSSDFHKDCPCLNNGH